MIDVVWKLGSAVKSRLARIRLEHRWARLRQLGMRIGHDVLLPSSTRIDVSHCFLISIGDHCGFDEDCVILAHDAQMDEFLDAARIGRVVVHPSCHVGARCVLLPGIEMGPRTIVGSNSVVANSLPPDSVCAGSPARVICGLDEYLEKHRRRLASTQSFPYDEYGLRSITPERRALLVAAVAHRDAYIVNGRSAELRGEGGSLRTPLRPG